jgi:hypothetical protein
MSNRSAVRVAVGVGVLVGVLVEVRVGVFVGVLVGVRVGVFVGVFVGVAVWVGVPVKVEVAVEVGVKVEVGGEPHTLKVDDVLRGFGAPVAKSVELLSVSVQPPPARRIAFVLLGAGAGDVSEQFAVPPYPT